MFRLSPVVKNLLIINVVIFLLSYFLFSRFGLDLVESMGLYYVGSDNFAPWQYFSYMFLHSYRTPGGGLYFGHIFGNMLGLIIFGTWLEELWGPKRFLQYYLIAGLGAGVLFTAVDFVEKRGMEADVENYFSSPNPAAFNALVVDHFDLFYADLQGLISAYEDAPSDPQLEAETSSVVRQLYERYTNIPMVGASGAIFGILLAVALLFPYRRVMLLFPPIPLRVRVLAILYGIYEIYGVLQRAPDDNVAHFAHLGGMLVGYIVLLAWGEARNRYY
jgi:membrane associated rhomboid family serine protease